MEIFLFHKLGKTWGNQKRVVYLRAGSSTCAFSWGLGTPLGSQPWAPLPQENALVPGTSCTTKPTYGDNHGSARCNVTWFSLSSPAILFHYWDSIVYLQQYVMIVVDPFQAYWAWLEWDQDHYGPTRGSFCIGMWQLAHVKAYIRPIVPRNTVAPVTIALPLVVKGFPEWKRFSQPLIHIPSMFNL
jgi:hypothetical protein